MNHADTFLPSSLKSLKSRLFNYDESTCAISDVDAAADANASTGTAAASVAAAPAAAADGAHGYRYQTAPRLLHALRPPARPEDFEVVLFKPAPAQQLLAAARRLLGK